jgi:hypothetical protein
VKAVKKTALRAASYQVHRELFFSAVAAFGLIEAAARELEDAHVALVPSHRELASANLPAVGSPDETVGVIAVHDLVAAARFIEKMVARLHVSYANGSVAVERNDMIGDQVLRRVHPAYGAADQFDPVVGLDSLRRAAGAFCRAGSMSSVKHERNNRQSRESTAVA